jgi:hypothetical protein
MLFSSVLTNRQAASIGGAAALSSSSSSRSTMGGVGTPSTPQPRLWVLAVYGTHDQIKLGYKHKDATLCARPWSHFFARAAVSPLILLHGVVGVGYDSMMVLLLVGT